MTIREATLEDIPDLIDMGMRFHAGSAYSALLQPSKAVVASSLRMLIESDSGAVFVQEREGELTGAILGIIVPHFVTGETVLGELSWWVDEGHRGAGLRLLAKLEGWARENGATKSTVIEPMGNPRIGQVYERMGYQMVEKSWMKAL